MQVVRSGESADRLLQELKDTLRRQDIVGLARLPEPRPGIKYRDILRKVFSIAGSVQAIVFVELEAGEESVRGKLLKYRDGLVQVTYYSEAVEGSAEKVFQGVNEVADLYEAAYEEAFARKISSIDIYYWLE